MKANSRLKDPGIIMVVVLIIIAAIVLVWWPTDIYLMGVSLAGWLMFFSYFAWFAISAIYIAWIERIEKQSEDNITDEKNSKKIS